MSWADTYELVTSVGDLAEDDIVLIVDSKTDGSAVALSGYKSQAAVTISSGTITIATPGAESLTLGGNSTDGWSFKNTSNKYVAYSGSGTGLTQGNDASGNALWTIAINSTTKVATITVKGGTRMIRRYSTTDFRAYANTSNGEDVYIYKKQVVDSRESVTLTFANTSVQKLVSDASHTQTVNVATSDGNDYDGTIAYSIVSSTSAGATINSASGAVSFSATGVITVKATAPATANYKKAEATYTITVKDVPTIVVADDDVDFGSTFTVDDDLIEGGDITVISGNTAIATVAGLVITPVATGTVTITVRTAENSTYISGEETFELTINAPTGKTTAYVPVTTIFEETFDESTGGPLSTWGGSEANGTLTTDVDGWTNVSGSGAGGCAKFGASKTAGSAKTPNITVENGKIYTLTFKAAPWSTDSSTMEVEVEGGTITGISTSAMETQEWNDFTGTITASSTTLNITFSASNNRFFLDEVKVTGTGAPLTATLNGSGYATYCSEYPLDFSGASDYSAWQITNISSSNVITFAKVTGSVKGGTGLLLKGTADATITLTSVNSTNTLGDNMLEGTLAPTYVAANKYYGLSGANFVKINAGTVKAGKAILDADYVTEAGVKAFTFIFEDDATGIRTVETVSAEEAAQIFNLAGQRINKMQKGINIINGRKVLK